MIEIKNPKNTLYGRWKQFCHDHKAEFLWSGCCGLMFLVGFGVGNFVKKTSIHTKPAQANYTTFVPKKQMKMPAEDPVATGESPTPTAFPSGTSSPACIVKGNISGSKKIYHVQGGAFYKTVKPEQCFNTEAEAVAAGFVKSKR